jgi:uncharacterized protein YbjT (DUF2867 family)
MNAEIQTPNAPILVTGGTGTLGRLVVARLREAGQTVRVLSRGKLAAVEAGAAVDPGLEYVNADLATGERVEPALEGVRIVLHLAGSAKGDEVKARSLVEAASAAGIRHLVYISVVGADRIPVKSAIDRAMFGYFAAKRAAEQVIAQSGLPSTTLRSTQFHQTNFRIVQGMARLPIVPVPAGWRFQPIDAAEVADRLVELALGVPVGLVADIGGPRIYEMSELLRSYLRAASKRRLILTIPIAGGAARAFREGANLTPNRAVGRRTWEEFLADRVKPTKATTSVDQAAEVKTSC